jgi:hypothetical protein
MRSLLVASAHTLLGMRCAHPEEKTAERLELEESLSALVITNSRCLYWFGSALQA